MARKYLLNSVRTGSTLHVAGSNFDTVTEAATLARIASAGGRLVDPDSKILAAVERVEAARARGSRVEELDTLMLAADTDVGTPATDADHVSYDDARQTPRPATVR